MKKSGWFLNFKLQIMIFHGKKIQGDVPATPEIFHTVELEIPLDACNRTGSLQERTLKTHVNKISIWKCKSKYSEWKEWCRKFCVSAEFPKAKNRLLKEHSDPQTWKKLSMKDLSSVTNRIWHQPRAPHSLNAFQIPSSDIQKWKIFLTRYNSTITKTNNW